MSLSKEQILKNSKKYFQTAESHGVMNQDLTNFLGEEFIKAPASTMKSMHNAFEGGLIDHLLNVTKYAVLMNNALPEKEKVDQKSLIRVCLLHQIGKAHMYKPCTSQWHVENQGKMYEYSDSNVSMRVGERSIFYAMSYGIKLTDEEYASIIMFDKNDDKMAEYHNTMIGYILKFASTLAILNEKNKAYNEQQS